MDNGSVLILYKYVDGAHFFIGGDKMSDGVCVANADIYVAYHEVTAQLAILAKENFGKEWTFEPEVSPEELTEWVRDSSARKRQAKSYRYHRRSSPGVSRGRWSPLTDDCCQRGYGR